MRKEVGQVGPEKRAHVRKKVKGSVVHGSLLFKLSVMARALTTRNFVALQLAIVPSLEHSTCRCSLTRALNLIFVCQQTPQALLQHSNSNEAVVGAKAHEQQ
jgi:hypothetical protein